MSERYEPRAVAGAGFLVVDRSTGRLLAGVGHDQHQVWAFPVNTPRGLPVTQESPFDHPFHRSVFVGQAGVVSAGRTSNFWAFHPDPRQPANPIFRNLGRMRLREPVAVDALADGVRFTHRVVWEDERGRPVLDETRSVAVRDLGDATAVDVRSRKEAAYGDLRFEATKHAAIGVRAQPQLLPGLGGEVVASCRGVLRRGRADDVVQGRGCGAVGYEADVAGLGRHGVVLVATDPAAHREGPWLCRDYGLALYNPTLEHPVDLPRGDVWTVGLRVLAYDGGISEQRVHRWQGVE